MALKFSLDSLDGVPEALHSLYEAKDGKYTLAVEGAVPRSRLDEFRDTNIATKRELDALKTQFEGVDVDLFKELKTQADKLRDKKLIDAGKIDELVNERVGVMKAESATALKAEKDRAEALTKQLNAHVIDGALRDAASKAGVAPTGIEDVLLRGRQVFRLHEGKATAFDGDKPIFGKGGDAMPVSEWVDGLSSSAPHLFTKSQGSGARGDGGAAGGKASITRAQWDGLDAAAQANAARTMTITE